MWNTDVKPFEPEPPGHPLAYMLSGGLVVESHRPTRLSRQTVGSFSIYLWCVGNVSGYVLQESSTAPPPLGLYTVDGAAYDVLFITIPMCQEPIDRFNDSMIDSLTDATCNMLCM